MKRFVKTKEPLLGLPKGFTEVEYLQSLDANNYAIDTGIIGHDGIESEVCVWFNSQVNNQCVLGSWSNASKRAWLCYIFGKKWYIGYVGTNQTTMDLVANQWNYVKTTIDTSGTQGRATLTVNNEVAGTVSYNKNWNNGVNLTLFRMNNDTGGDYYGATCKVSLCKIWDNGVLVRHFVPCLDPAGVPCMYDKVQGKAYYNTASGTFQYGKQIIPVEYLESTGTQYIDTGISYILGDRIELSVAPLEINVDTVIFGEYSNNVGSIEMSCYYGKYRANLQVISQLPEEAKYTIGVKNTLKCIENGQWEINGVLFGSARSVANNNSSYLFCRNYPSSPKYSKCRVYNLNIIRNGTLVRDYIPVIDEDNAGYMFDKVSHTLYANKGTGDFTYGEKVYAHKLRLIEENTQLNGLPNGFTEVEYLEATGTQYIDTGVILANPLKVDMELAMLHPVNSGTADSNYPVMFGANDGDTRRNIFIRNNYGDYQSDTGCRVEVDIGNTYNRKDINYGKRFKFYYDQSVSTNNTIIDDTTYTYPVGDWNVSCSLYLFAQNNNGTLFRRGVGRVYRCKLWISNVLVRDFIPVLDPAGTPCMYDFVNKKVYYNKGTGDFAYGKQIIPVEYVQSTGTQYIDMGFKPNQDTRITADFEYTQEPNNKGFIFGAGISATSTAFEFYPWGSSWNSPYNNTNIQIASGLSSMAGQKFHLDKNKNVLDVIYEDGTAKNSSATYATFETTRTLWLFAINRGSMEATYFSNCVKLYNCQIYDNDKLIYDLIPVIDENNVGYMFDKLSHSLYVNAGADPFVYGNKIYSNKKRMRFGADPWFMKDYIQLSYIESSGTQYIDTGCTVDSSTDEIELNFECTDSTIYKWFFGEYDDNARIGLGTGDGTDKRNFLYQQSATKVSDTTFYNSKHTFLANTSGAYLNGTKIRDYTSFASTSTIYLFNLNIDSTTDYRGKAKIWSYKHKRNGQYIRYLIPVKRKSDNKYGMLDLVTKQFYDNAGTGDFTGE